MRLNLFSSKKLGTLFFSLLLSFPVSLLAQPTEKQKGRPPQKDWSITVGVAPLVSPAFLGSRDYYFQIFPDLRIRYKDLLFGSVDQGVGLNLIRQKGWRIGPIAKYVFSRQENEGSSPFRIAGRETVALEGLGNIAGTIEVGAFAEYSWKKFRGKAEFRRAVSSYKGLVAEFNADYIDRFGPLMISLGPRLNVADDNFNTAYFGITPQQSLNSGLPVYTPQSSLVSYGVRAVAIMPLPKNLSLVAFGGYSRMAGDPAKSPLVTERGSKNQGIGGMALGYSFNFGPVQNKKTERKSSANH